MTTQEIISSILDNLHEATPGPEFTRQMVLNWVNQGQRRLAAKTLCLQDTVELSTVIGTERYLLPTTYIRARQVAIGDKVLEPVNPTAYVEGNSGEPDFYYLWEDAIGLLPIPSAVQTVRMIYYKGPETLTDNDDEPEINERWHEYLIAFGSWKGCQKRGDVRLSEYYRSEWVQLEMDVRQEMNYYTEQRPRRVKDVRYGSDYPYHDAEERSWYNDPTHL